MILVGLLMFLPVDLLAFTVLVRFAVCIVLIFDFSVGSDLGLVVMNVKCCDIGNALVYHQHHRSEFAC